MSKLNCFLFFCLDNQRETYAVRRQDDGGEDGEDTLHQHDCFREGERPESFDGVGNSELNQNVEVIPSLCSTAYLFIFGLT